MEHSMDHTHFRELCLRLRVSLMNGARESAINALPILPGHKLVQDVHRSNCVTARTLLLWGLELFSSCVKFSLPR
jgi:hypothetical protein